MSAPEPAPVPPLDDLDDDEAAELAALEAAVAKAQADPRRASRPSACLRA